MKFSIILLLLIIVTLFEHTLTFYFPNGLVHKGKLFKTKDYPYVMYLRLYRGDLNEYYECSGSLIKKMFVLTAGHCCFGYNTSEITVCQGSPLDGPKFHNIVKIYLHEEYDPISNDICVLKLEKAFPNIMKFSKIGGSIDEFSNGKKVNCTIFGFGDTGDVSIDGNSGYMMTNDIVYGPKACKNYDGERVRTNWKQYLCLVPKGNNEGATPCQGDSGGPMICNNLQYGICSFMYPFEGNETKCGRPDQQVVYISLLFHEKWLKNIIGSKKKKKRSSGNLLKPLHYTLHIILSILLCSMLTLM